MMAFTYQGRRFIAGQKAVLLLGDYARALARRQQSDGVELHAYSADGTIEEITLIVGAGIPLLTETSHSTLPRPANAIAEEYLQERLEALTGDGWVGDHEDGA